MGTADPKQVAGLATSSLGANSPEAKQIQKAAIAGGDAWKVVVTMMMNPALMQRLGGQ